MDWHIFKPVYRQYTNAHKLVIVDKLSSKLDVIITRMTESTTEKQDSFFQCTQDTGMCPTCVKRHYIYIPFRLFDSQTIR